MTDNKRINSLDKSRSPVFKDELKADPKLMHKIITV